MSISASRFIRICLLTLGVAILAGKVQATGYYVDYSAGDDTAAGTTTTTAWKHCPGDPVASGAVAAASLSPGDTVFFKGGVTYVFTASYKNFLYQAICNPGISLNWAGSPSSPITYDGNSSGAWGTGRAIFTDNCSTNQIAAFFGANSMSNLVFNYLEIGPIGGSATLPADPGTAINPNPGGGISTAAGLMRNVTVENCYFHQLGYYFNQKPMSSGSLSGGAVGSAGCDNVTITNCEFTQMNCPIGFSVPTYVSNLTVVNCNFHDYIVWCMWFGFQSPTASMDNVFIRGNTFQNNDQGYSTDVWTGYGFPPHQDGINFFADSVTNINCGPNIDIYDNYFANTTTHSGGTACIFLVGNASANIYNNVFANNSVNNGVVTMNLSSTNTPYYVRLLNNTFYENGPTAFYGGVGGTIPLTNNLVLLENNIICQVAPGYNGYGYVLVGPYKPTTNVFFIDYNCYISANWNGSAVGFWGGLLGYLTIPNMQANGWDLHGFLKDPLFVNAAGNDLHLKTNSPAIGAGLNLTSLHLPGLMSDRDGNPRPAQGAWTIGAYQGGGAVALAQPPAPTGLHIKGP